MPFDRIVFPFYRALKAENAAHLRLVGFQDDHYFNKTRKELAKTIINGSVIIAAKNMSK